MKVQAHGRISGGKDKTVKLWDSATGLEALSLQGHSKTVTSVTFSPDGKRLASASLDGTIKLWDATLSQPRDESSQRQVRW